MSKYLYFIFRFLNILTKVVLTAIVLGFDEMISSAFNGLESNLIFLLLPNLDFQMAGQQNISVSVIEKYILVSLRLFYRLVHLFNSRDTG